MKISWFTSLLAMLRSSRRLLPLLEKPGCISARRTPIRGETLSARHFLKTSNCDQKPVVLLSRIVNESIKGNTTLSFNVAIWED